MTKILQKYHDIPSSGLRGVMDTRCEPPYDINIVYIAKSMLCNGKPKKLIWSKYKIGGAKLNIMTKILWKFHEIPLTG